MRNFAQNRKPASFMSTQTQRHKRNVRSQKNLREWKAIRKHMHVVPKPGVLPLSIFYPTHPLRLYGPESTQYKERNRKEWE